MFGQPDSFCADKVVRNPISWSGAIISGGIDAYICKFVIRNGIMIY
jgi:hypothetical protein